jgi:hypothetical protein
MALQPTGLRCQRPSRHPRLGCGRGVTPQLHRTVIPRARGACALAHPTAAACAGACRLQGSAVVGQCALASARCVRQEACAQMVIEMACDAVCWQPLGLEDNDFNPFVRPCVSNEAVSQPRPTPVLVALE